MTIKLTRTLLVLLLMISAISLVLWAIVFVEEIKYQVATFAVVGGMFTALTSVFTIAYNHEKQKQREIELDLAKEKKRVCEHFYNVLFIAFSAQVFTHQNNEKVDIRLAEEYMLFKKGLMNWGSDKLIAEFILYDTQIQIKNQPLHQMMINAERFMKAIRKEIGFNDKMDLNIFDVILSPEARSDQSTK